MFGLTPFETIQVIAWIITGTAAIVTPVVAVKWLTADFRDFKAAVKRDLESLRGKIDGFSDEIRAAVKRDLESLSGEVDGFSDEIKADLRDHVQGLHNRIDRHEAKYDSEILRIDSRISETRERVAAIRG